MPIGIEKNIRSATEASKDWENLQLPVRQYAQARTELLQMVKKMDQSPNPDALDDLILQQMHLDESRGEIKKILGGLVQFFRETTNHGFTQAEVEEMANLEQAMSDDKVELSTMVTPIYLRGAEAMRVRNIADSKKILDQGFGIRHYKPAEFQTMLKQLAEANIDKMIDVVRTKVGPHRNALIRERELIRVATFYAPKTTDTKLKETLTKRGQEIGPEIGELESLQFEDVAGKNEAGDDQPILYILNDIMKRLIQEKARRKDEQEMAEKNTSVQDAAAAIAGLT